jgi:formylglycine-generating enzyme required for sulfatase activity
VAPGSDTGNSANCNFAVGASTNVGAYALSDSPYGTYDQGGNVSEWNETIHFTTNRGSRGGD